MLTHEGVLNGQMHQFNSEFFSKLRNIYYAENYCLHRIPGLVNKIPRNDLWRLLDNHLPVMAERKKRLEIIFNELDIKTGGAVCHDFKKLIGRAGTIIYHSNIKANENLCDLISTLLEISIYRSHIYYHLSQTIEKLEKPFINAALKRCLSEEDDFFHSLLEVKKLLSPVELNANFSSLQSV
jgi:ferritin-like metal-binding protein YciE